MLRRLQFIDIPFFRNCLIGVFLSFLKGLGSTFSGAPALPRDSLVSELFTLAIESV